MEEDSGERRYGATDIRRYAGAGTSIGTAIWTRIFFIIVVIIILVLIVAAYFFLTSASGERFIDTIKEKGISTYQFIPGLFTRAESVGMNAWEAENVAGFAAKSGIVFKEFKALSMEVPQGAQLTASYNLGIENTDLEPTRLDIGCKMKGKDMVGEIIPADVMLEGRRVTKNVRCRFSPEQTFALEGTQTVVGTVSYPYQTKDISLPVYFTSFNIFNKELDAGEDFFEHYGIPETNPIRAEYSGEPVEIGIGVSTENVQPVVIEENVEALIGITLSNKWSGRVKDLEGLRLEVPVEMTISELSNAPSLMCPFMASREGRVFREYVMDSEFLGMVELKRGSRHTFECYFDVDESLLEAGQPYTKREYRVTADYVYELPEKTVSVTIKKSGEEEEVLIEGELEVTEVEAGI